MPPRSKTIAKLVDQNGISVARNAQGQPIAHSNNPKRKLAWREVLGKLTGNGTDLLAKMHAIANGEIFTPVGTDRDGREFQPMVPTIEQQLHAQQMLWEYLHGKAVAQTEVVKASEAADELERLKALSDDELHKLISVRRLSLEEKNASDQATAALPSDDGE